MSIDPVFEFWSRSFSSRTAFFNSAEQQGEIHPFPAANENHCRLGFGSPGV